MSELERKTLDALAELIAADILRRREQNEQEAS